MAVAAVCGSSLSLRGACRHDSASARRCHTLPLWSGVASRQSGRNSRLSVTVGMGKNKGFGKVPVQQTPPPPKPTPPPLFMPGSAPEPEKDESLPGQVADRIIGRIVLFSGVPMLLGFASGPYVYYMKLVEKVELEPALLYTIGTVLFGMAAVGISYGALSASWDPSRESEGWGVEDFKRNFAVVTGRKPAGSGGRR